MFNQLFNDSSFPYYHCVISSKTFQTNVEPELLILSKNPIFENGTGIISLHRNANSSHIHWIHQCRSWKKRRGCNCTETRKIRSLGFKIKFSPIQATELHERNLLSYLSKPGRTTLTSFDKKENRLAEFLSIQANTKRLPGESRNNIFRCEFDSGCEGLKLNSADIKAPKDLRSICIEGGVPTRSVKSESETKAQQLQDIILRKFPKTIELLNFDHEYRTLFSNWYYDKSSKLGIITHRVWDDVLHIWSQYSIENIISIRESSTFDDKLYLSIDYSTYILAKILHRQNDRNIDKTIDFINNLYLVINRELNKINTINIIGPAGGGKTFVFESLSTLVWQTGRIEANLTKFNQFPFEHMQNKRLAIFNEFSCSDSHKDLAKEVFEGLECCINVKYKPKTLFKPCPIIITSNNLWHLNFNPVDQEAFAQRMKTYFWTSQGWLKNIVGYPHPLAWKNIFKITSEQLNNILSNEPELDYINHKDDSLNDTQL